MGKPFPPQTMKAWQYTSNKGGIEKNFKLNSTPLPKPKPNQHLVQIIYAALNPVDYKPAEIPFMFRFAITKPATPGIDFAGRIVTPAAGSALKPGQLVFGVSGNSPFAGGALREFNVAGVECVVPIPEGVDSLDVATIGVAGMTAYQSIVPRVKRGDSIFINGGSGGVGVFGIQLAKITGCHVTTSCSTRNVDFCKSLGADEVIDYTKGSVAAALISGGRKFDHAVDNVGSDDELVVKSAEYLKPGASFVKVAGDLSPRGAIVGFKRKNFPVALGGLKSKLEGFWPKMRADNLTEIGEWIKEGKIRPVIDEKFSFEQVSQAFEKLKTGRARGKIVVDVASETYMNGWMESA